MVQAADPPSMLAKRKAISTLFPFAICLERGGSQAMANAIFRVAGASIPSEFMWRHVKPSFATLFNELSPPSLDLAIILTAPYLRWDRELNAEDAVARWAAAVSRVSHTEEVAQNVVDALLQIACIDFLRPHIPSGLWVWLKKRPLLPPVCQGRLHGATSDVVRHIRGLGDIEITRSYFLLIWSEWDLHHLLDLYEIKISIREDFGGIGMCHHRRDLIERLDHAVGELGRGLEYFKRRTPWVNEDSIPRRNGQLGELKGVLLEVDGEAMETLTRMPPCLVLFEGRADSCEHLQNPTRPSSALCLSRAHDLPFGLERSGIHPFGPCARLCPVVSSPYISLLFRRLQL